MSIMYVLMYVLSFSAKDWLWATTGTLVHKKNVYQGVTPLMHACATGLADCVQYLANHRARFDRLDNKNRGCLQRCRQCQGKGQTLATWLLNNNVKGLVDSHGKGRDWEDRSSGQFTQQFRAMTGPKANTSKWEGKGNEPHQGHAGNGNGEGKGKGYEPHQGQAHANRHSGQVPSNSNYYFAGPSSTH